MSAPSPSAGDSARADIDREEVQNALRTPPSALPADDVPEQEDGVLLQQIMRFRNRDGTETIYATLRGEFAPGERGVTLFLGFCPPFAHVPVIEAEAIEGPGAMVKVAQLQNNGAQIDIQLEQPSLEPVEVVVEVAALPANSPQ